MEKSAVLGEDILDHPLRHSNCDLPVDNLDHINDIKLLHPDVLSVFRG